VAAIRAAQLGKSVAVVESKYWGGVCLNVGCIPSKALLRNAELAHLVRDEAKTFGISGDVTFDFGAAFDRSRTVADGRVKGVHFLMKKNKITEFDGWGEFTDAHTLQVALNGGGTETVTFDNVIIATGTTTKLLPGTQLSERVVTYEEQIMTRELPGSVIIAGAGAIGVEFAFVLRNYGVQVTIVEFLDRLLPLEDEAVSKELAKAYRKLGIDVLTSTKVENIDDSGEQVTVTVSDAKGTRELTADKVLQAIGFQPRVEGYGLEKLGVQLTDRGAIEIDDYMRTNVPHVYAIGDVTAKLMLAHVGEAQGVVAAETIAGAETQPLSYPMMPRATFCSPQVASFGYTEAQARELADRNGWKVKVAQFPFTANGKAQGLGAERLRQADRGRDLRGAARRPPDRARGDRAAAGADAGADVGPDRHRARAERARAPDAQRGAAGGVPRPHRAHDQPVTCLSVGGGGWTAAAGGCIMIV
jgi:dihydrolipoamide dehydrogenase